VDIAGNYEADNFSAVVGKQVNEKNLNSSHTNFMGFS